MYVAVKGGERAIENAHRLLAHERRGEFVEGVRKDHDLVPIAQPGEELARARERFGWQARIPLEEGMRETIAWYRGQR